MWRTHQLRVRRQDGQDALRALQIAEDNYFGKHARYASESELRAADPKALAANSLSARGHYKLSVTKSHDDLGYSITARAQPREGQTMDTRCVELRIDQNGRRFAIDDAGEDRSADCWR